MKRVPVHWQSAVGGALFVLVVVVPLGWVIWGALAQYTCAQPIQTVNGVSYCGPPPSR